jgi:hypothetical protein
VKGIPSFEVDVYGAIVYVCRDRAEVDRCLKSLGCGLESHEAVGAGISIEVARTGGLAWHVMGVFDGGLDTLAHEASHIVDLILKRKQITGDVDTEVRAYLLGYIVGEAGKRLRGMKWPKRPPR